MRRHIIVNLLVATLAGCKASGCPGDPNGPTWLYGDCNAAAAQTRSVESAVPPALLRQCQYDADLATASAQPASGSLYDQIDNQVQVRKTKERLISECIAAHEQ